MKLADEVSPEKLRGGFYSPPALVNVCWDSAFALLDGREGLRALEPSAGDGAFVRGLAGHPQRAQVTSLDAVELLPEEAAKVEAAMTEGGVDGRVRVGSFLSTAMSDLDGYDVAVGNPPFLRYQFVNDDDLFERQTLERKIGKQLGRVSNLWIAVFLSAVTRLRDGGAFSFILPSESLTGVSAGVVRWWLSEHTSALRVELFPPKSFPGALQEVVVVSGRVTRGAGAGEVAVVDHVSNETHSHVVNASDKTWTGLTLHPADVEVVRAAAASKQVRLLGKVARLGVSTVTGANDFFTYSDEVRRSYELAAWSRPLLSRTRHAPGLTVTVDDWRAASEAGEKSWLLDVSRASENEGARGLHRYLGEADAAGIPLRYKTRIRSPWYQVPIVSSKPLLLSKRSHRFPRLIANSAGLLTTDTIYQGKMLPGYDGMDRRLVSGFHNSLTLLSAEIEGRSFGGGVLELVPSEINRLLVIDPNAVPDALDDLDRIARERGYESEDLVHATNAALIDGVPGLDPDLITAAEGARQRLLGRRMARAG